MDKLINFFVFNIDWLVPVGVLLSVVGDAFRESGIERRKVGWLEYHIPKWMSFYIPLFFIVLIWYMAVNEPLYLILLIAASWLIWKLIYLRKQIFNYIFGKILWIKRLISGY